MNCFSHLFTLQFTHPFVIVRFEVFQREIHGMVPFCKLVWYLSIIYKNGDGDSCLRERMGTGTIPKLVTGIEVGMGSEFWGRSGMGINICPHAAL